MPKSRTRTIARKRNYVPYVKRFRPPNRKEAIEACGDIFEREELKPHSSFKPIPKCTSQDDWLAQYCEQGQSFTEFIQTSPWLSTRKRKGIKQKFVPSEKTLQTRYPEGAIYLLPLGEFNNESSPDFQNLVQYTQIFFNMPVKALPKMELLPAGSDDVHCRPYDSKEKLFYLKSRSKGEKRQLNIYSILNFVRDVAPDDALATIALTMSDLYEDKPDLFVAGMASGNARVGVFSFCRYDPNIEFSSEFWYEMKKKKHFSSNCDTKKLMLVRSCRLLVHEVAHILGIAHCIFYECCMNGSGHLEEDFRQPMFLCPVDLHKLSYLCGFNILQRYEKLRQFYSKFDLVDEMNWIDKRLKDLKESNTVTMKPKQSPKSGVKQKNDQTVIEFDENVPLAQIRRFKAGRCKK